MYYESSDKAIAHANEHIVKDFADMRSVLAIDELNVLNSVKSLYEDLYKYFRKLLILLAKKVYAENRREKDLKSLSDQWVDELLEGYDPVSRYVYNHEFDRRRARLFEAIMSQADLEEILEAAKKSMALMFRIYADRVTFEANRQAIKDEGEEWVKWVAEKDEKTCKVCISRDGTRYPVDNVPPPPHIHCRCWLERA